MMKKFFKKIKSAAKDITRGFAFIYRNACATKRNFGWFLANTFYYIISGLSIVFIGVASKDQTLTTNLFIGVLLWGYLSTIFDEIAQSITYEKWESTIEYTFMAPVSRASHLFNISLYSIIIATVRSFLLTLVCINIFDLNFLIEQYANILFIMIISTFSFVGLGLMAAVLPLFNTEHGAQAVYIVQGLLLLVSGVYYPVEILPKWVQIFSHLSPATYTLNACRKILLENTSIVYMTAEVYTLLIISLICIPLGLFVFSLAERFTKIHGKLKRNG